MTAKLPYTPASLTPKDLTFSTVLFRSGPPTKLANSFLLLLNVLESQFSLIAAFPPKLPRSLTPSKLGLRRVDFSLSTFLFLIGGTRFGVFTLLLGSLLIINVFKCFRTSNMPSAIIFLTVLLGLQESCIYADLCFWGYRSLLIEAPNETFTFCRDQATSHSTCDRRPWPT